MRRCYVGPYNCNQIHPHVPCACVFLEVFMLELVTFESIQCVCVCRWFIEQGLLGREMTLAEEKYWKPVVYVVREVTCAFAKSYTVCSNGCVVSCAQGGGAYAHAFIGCVQLC